MSKKYLTKSRFKLALECPTKLRFTLDSERYANQKADNPFLLALAEGGFQVGEWAKLHFPEGKDCVANDNELALAQTLAWLKSGESVIFEAAIKSGYKYVRVDILEITDTEIRVIEVKSKSLAGGGIEQFRLKNGGVNKDWKPYIEDVAFQVHVVREHFESQGINLPVKGYLMCPDKRKTCTTDGMHEHFVLRRDERNCAYCQVKPEVTLDDLGESMMIKVDVSTCIEAVTSDITSYMREGWECATFEGAIEWLERLMKMYDKGFDIPFLPVGIQCSKCSFTTSREIETQGKVSGRRACFTHALDWSQVEFDRPKVWDVWNLRGNEKRIAEGRWFMDQLTDEDFNDDVVHPDELSGHEKLRNAQRQWIQVSAAKGDFTGTFLDLEGLRTKISKFEWPLHFIDFETTAPAIPFYKGYSSYQGVSFQFSHHVMHKGGRLEHKGQYLGPGLGTDPTYAFVDALYEELRHDEGSVFMYSHHENTYLNYAHSLLETSSPFGVRKTNDLLSFLKSLTYGAGINKNKWAPSERVMIDMAKLVRAHFWHPDMAGSNSIKQVLPAVLNASAELQEKYEKPTYGTSAMPSCNRSEGFAWVVRNPDGRVEDPYKRLPKIGRGKLGDELNEIERLYSEDTVGNGGAAMTAWSYMQFAAMSEEERQELKEALLHYCELDTLAMAFIMEYFLLEIKKL